MAHRADAGTVQYPGSAGDLHRLAIAKRSWRWTLLEPDMSTASTLPLPASAVRVRAMILAPVVGTPRRAYPGVFVRHLHAGPVGDILMLSGGVSRLGRTSGPVQLSAR
jgi:hypothetical protein